LNFGLNISYNRNEVKNFNGIVDTGSINGQGLTGAFAQRIVGDQPLYAFYLREFLGFDQNGLSIYNGDFQQFLGKSPIPKYNLGFSIGMRHKNWDASAFLAGQFGHYVYNNTANAFFSMGSLGNGRNVTEDVLFIGESNLNAPDVSDRFLEKGDFLRMQNVVLGYNFNLGESQGRKLRVFASGQNLFVLTGYSGLDPEVNVNKAMNDVPSLGIDYVAYPRARTFTLGLNFTF
jgi:iron complex outermembrane receptor protein